LYLSDVIASGKDISMKSAKELVTVANSRVVTVRVEDALPLVGDRETVFIDVRDSVELHSDGRIPGAVHVNRGMLEFVLDPASPNHNSVFSSGKKIIFYCASGGRSALAADTAQQMGLQKVVHLGGGFKAWAEAGGAVEKLRPA
jgi:rhodanese-related sulfurtransferase